MPPYQPANRPDNQKENTMKRITAIAISVAALIGSCYVGASSASVETQTPVSQFCRAQGFAQTAMILAYESHSAADRERLVKAATLSCEMGRLAMNRELLKQGEEAVESGSGRLTPIAQAQMWAAFQSGFENRYRTIDQMKAERGNIN